MKYLIVFAIVAFVAFVAADEESKPADGAKMDDDIKIRNTCVNESGLTQEQMDRMRNNEPPNEKEFHDYALCYAKKLDLFTEEDRFNVDRVVAYIASANQPAEKVRVDVENCVNAIDANATPAVRAYQGVSCLMKKNAERRKQD